MRFLVHQFAQQGEKISDSNKRMEENAGIVETPEQVHIRRSTDTSGLVRDLDPNFALVGSSDPIRTMQTNQSGRHPTVGRRTQFQTLLPRGTNKL